VFRHGTAVACGERVIRMTKKMEDGRMAKKIKGERMTEKEISVVLREMARGQRKPLCDAWYGEWKDDSSVDELLDKFVRGMDFCVENDYPPLPFIRKFFDKDDLHRHRIYLDEEVALDGNNGSYVFLGECSGEIVCDGYMTVNIVVRHRSKIKVVAMGGSRVYVDVYEEGDCAANIESGSTCKVYGSKGK